MLASCAGHHSASTCQPIKKRTCTCCLAPSCCHTHASRHCIQESASIVQHAWQSLPPKHLTLGFLQGSPERNVCQCLQLLLRVPRTAQLQLHQQLVKVIPGQQQQQQATSAHTQLSHILSRSVCCCTICLVLWHRYGQLWRQTCMSVTANRTSASTPALNCCFAGDLSLVSAHTCQSAHCCGGPAA